MTEVTRILEKIESGDPDASELLLPLVYTELRRLAAAKIAQEKPGQTLQATALVHEAYVRLVDVDQGQSWDTRRHFFAAAAEAMRRILIQRYREKNAQKRGGGMQRHELRDMDLATHDASFDLLAVGDAVDQLVKEDYSAGELAKLRIFAGLSIDEAADALGIPRSSAYRLWAYGQSWLRAEIADRE